MEYKIRSCELTCAYQTKCAALELEKGAMTYPQVIYNSSLGIFR